MNRGSNARFFELLSEPGQQQQITLNSKDPFK